MSDKIATRKKRIVDYYRERLYKIAENSINKKKYEAALEAIASCAELEYQWNQFYRDERLEQYLKEIQGIIMKPSYGQDETDLRTILFYDGFGYDIRGLMINYVESLLALGYRVIYVVSALAQKQQPTLDKIARNQNLVREYLAFPQDYLVMAKSLNEIYAKYHPKKAILYILPYDVAGIVVFGNYQGIVERYQINLTDHAFWLGKYAFDYCIEFRDYGAVISRVFRGINQEKLLKLPLTPYVDETLSFEGFPFEAEGHKVVFSGGGLYKTFDAEHTYYRIVEDILRYDEEVLFLYAGFGDDSELKELMRKFPARIWHIEERRDLYQLMEHVYFYLSTYPIAGGLMTQYAALAGKVPVTIGTGDEHAGVLCVAEECQYQFQNRKEAQEEIHRLLDNPDYAKAKGQKLKESIPGKKQFVDALGQIIDEHISPYEIRYDKIETDSFIREYLYRFSLGEIQRVIIKDEHWELRRNFPLLFLRKRIRNFITLLKKRG